MAVAAPAAPESGAAAPSGEEEVRARRGSTAAGYLRQVFGFVADNPVVRWIEGTLGITASGLVLALLIVLGWLLAHHFGGRALYLMCYAGVAVLAGAYVVSRRRPPVTAVRSKIPTRAREGQRLTIEITLSAKRRVTTLLLQEKLPPFLGRSLVRPVAVVSPGRPQKHTYLLEPKLRGVYRVGPTSVSWNDPFGLTRGEMHLAEPVEILVHPATELAYDRPLTRQWEDPPIRPPRSKPWPTGFEFYGMRDYVAGDDLRRVVWRAAARTGKLMVRESEQGVTDRVVILLNTMRNVHRPGRPSETFETAVRAAASLGVRHLRDGFSVSLEANSKQLAKNLRGPRARLLLLDHLARVEMDREPLSRSVERLLMGPKAHAHYIVLTPHLSQQAAGRLRLLTETGASLLVVTILWEDFDPLTERRAAEIGAQIVNLKPGQPLSGVTARSLGAGINLAALGAR